MTKKDEPQVCYSPEDEKQFGVRTARATNVTEESIREALDFCRDKKIELLIARCNTMDIQAAQGLEKEGCLLADTLIDYVRNLVRTTIPPPPDKISTRLIREGEEKIVEEIAADAFRGYGGHYQADNRLAHVKPSEIYSSWALSSCLNRDHTHDVLVSEYNGSIVGFMTVRLNSPREGEGPLAGVVTSARNRSLILRALSIGAMNWFRSLGASRCVASLLLTNRVMQRIMSRLDFEPGESYYTFHKWF